MPSNRYFAPVALQQGERVFLEQEESRHLSHVMRTKIGEKVEIVNGKGQLAIAEFTSLKKDNAELLIESVFVSQEKTTEIILAQAIPRLNRLEFIIEKGTELGVFSFWLFPSINSEKDELSPNQRKRLEMLSISAMKQSGRLSLPSILYKEALTSWEKLSGALFYGDTREEAPWLSHFSQELCKSPIVIFIGPEKGFHAKEISYLEGIAKGIKLHDNILRVDTAPLVALSQLSLLFH